MAEKVKMRERGREEKSIKHRRCVFNMYYVLKYIIDLILRID